MARIRSASRTRSRLSDCARWELRSMLRSMPTSSEPSDAGAPSHALVPALATSTSDSPRSMLILRAIASASGLRQVLPVQTNRTFMRSRVSDQVGHALAQLCRRYCPRTDDPRSASRAVDDGGRRRGCQASAVEHPKLTARDCVAPLRKNLSRRRGRRNPRAVRARRCDGVAVRANETRDPGVARPADRDASLGPAQPIGNAPLSPRQYEREWPGPVARREIRGVRWQMQVEPLEQVAAGNE